MRNSEMRMSAYELIEGKNSKLEVSVILPVCLANIVQSLYELIESYRFFYFGIDAPDESIEHYKKTLELGFPYAAQCTIATHRHHAEILLAANFALNIVEIMTEGLIESMLTLRAIALVKSHEDYSTATESLKKSRKELLNFRFPALLEGDPLVALRWE